MTSIGSSSLRQVRMAGFCVLDNIPRGSIKDAEFFDQLRNWKLRPLLFCFTLLSVFLPQFYSRRCTNGEFQQFCKTIPSPCILWYCNILFSILDIIFSSKWFYCPVLQRYVVNKQNLCDVWGSHGCERSDLSSWLRRRELLQVVRSVPEEHVSTVFGVEGLVV
jgi:hypothetical protein